MGNAQLLTHLYANHIIRVKERKNKVKHKKDLKHFILRKKNIVSYTIIQYIFMVILFALFKDRDTEIWVVCVSERTNVTSWCNLYQWHLCIYVWIIHPLRDIIWSKTFSFMVIEWVCGNGKVNVSGFCRCFMMLPLNVRV